MNELTIEEIKRLLAIYRDGENYISLEYRVGIYSTGELQDSWKAYREDVGHTKEHPTKELALAELLGKIAAKDK